MYINNNQIRGISFLSKASDYKILTKILDGTDYEQYYWSISEDEILIRNSAVNIANDKIIKGKQIKQLIEQANNSTIISINAKASYIPYNKEIINYNDFLESPYQIIFLCSDTIYYEIYSKEIKFIEKVKANAVKNNFLNIEYITDENDGRTSMSVM